MEQHPVPRNISSFEFHLIGDMTVKQFGYMAAGGILAFLLYKTLPFPSIIKYPVAGLVLLSGFAFAFMPIQERPLDKWLLAFLKSINSPTQYLWQKYEEPPAFLTRSFRTPAQILPKKHQEAHIDAEAKLKAYLATTQTQPHHTLNIQEQKYVNSTLKLFSSTYDMQPQIASAPVKKQTGDDIQQKTPEVSNGSFQKMQLPQHPQPSIQPVLTQNKPQAPPNIQPQSQKASAPTPVQPQPQTSGRPSLPSEESQKIQKNLTDLQKEKESLQKELDKLKRELENMSKPDIIKPEIEKEKVKPTIKTVTPKTAAEEIGIPKLPQTPNMVMGVVKNVQNQLLPNIILTVKDKKQEPCRALKTNRLGQFSTATPLKNGTYFVEAEDPLKRYVFDIAQINLDGKVFLPIEITAKGEKEILREKLSKELFGGGATI